MSPDPDIDRRAGALVACRQLCRFASAGREYGPDSVQAQGQVRPTQDALLLAAVVGATAADIRAAHRDEEKTS